MNNLIFCINCGEKYITSAEFCGKCGKAKPKSKPAEGLAAQDSTSSASVLTQVAPKKSKLGLIIGLASGGLLLVLVAVAFVVISIQHSSPSYLSGLAAGENAAADQWSEAWWDSTESMCLDKSYVWPYENESDFLAGCRDGYNANASDY